MADTGDFQTGQEYAADGLFLRLGERLEGSLQAEPRLRRGPEEEPPRGQEIGSLVDDLLALVFPGYFGLRSGEKQRAELLAARVESIAATMADLMTRVTQHRAWSERQAVAFFDGLPGLRHLISLDVQAAVDGDPSCHEASEAILCLPGVEAIAIHRLAHTLLRQGVPLIPRMMNRIAFDRTCIDIHPGARIGRSFFIDHGSGVVIGETSSIGEFCKLYQGVTLGAKSLPRDAQGRIQRHPKRHPTLEDHVTVYAGATILGGDTVVGSGSSIAGGVFLTESVPPGHLVTGPKPEMKLRANPDRPPVSFDI